MAKRYPLKITVIKKLSAKEVYGHALLEVTDDFPAYCDRLDAGKEFIVEESGAMPSGCGITGGASGSATRPCLRASLRARSSCLRISRARLAAEYRGRAMRDPPFPLSSHG
jgi:hypothetical protein